VFKKYVIVLYFVATDFIVEVLITMMKNESLFENTIKTCLNFKITGHCENTNNFTHRI